MDLLKYFRREKSLPTTKQDAIAYQNGGRSTLTSTFNTYAASVESLEAAIRVAANVASMANMGVYRESNDGLKKYPVKNIDLTYNINEFDSQNDFIRKLFSSILMHGAAIVVAAADSTTGLIMFYVYNPARFKINATENNMVYEYIYTSEGGTEVKFKPEDVIYISDGIAVDNLLYPTSRLSAMKDLLTLQANIMRQQSEYYSAGGKDSVILSPKEPIAAEKAKLLKETFDAFINTTSTKALYLNNEIDVKSVSNAQTPNQVLEALTKINDQVVRSFGVPAYLLGDYQGYVSDAAVQTAARLYFQIQLKPIFKSIEHGFTKYFRTTLGLKNAVVRFDYKDIEILEDTLSTKVELAEKLFKLGALSINELREAAEYLPLSEPSADYHHLPAFLQSGNPVALENYEEAVAINAGLENPEKPSGSSGGADNEPVNPDGVSMVNSNVNSTVNAEQGE